MATATLESSAKADTGQMSLDSLSEDLRTASPQLPDGDETAFGRFWEVACHAGGALRVDLQENLP